jgi:AcrR family transcriptional regulator
MVAKQIKNKTKDREATEERLLLAAEQIFSKFGFKGATTRMIAQKADINVALITRYFDGKYGLLLKLVERKAIEMHETLLPYPAKSSVTEECMAFAIHKYEYCINDIKFFRIVIAQFLTDPKFLKQFQEVLLTLETYTDFETRLNILIENNKMVKDVPIKSVFETIETYVFGLIIGQIVDDLSNVEAKEKIKDFIRIYGKGLEK